MRAEERNTVTFMFTDIEGSTRLWEEHDTDMEAVLAQHDEIFHGTVHRFGGKVFKHTGDGLAAAFPRIQSAASAALEAQRLMAQSDWGPVGELRSRIGIHTGPAQERMGEYFGRDVNRCARIMDAGHGGQVLISGPTADILSDLEPEKWQLRDLGVHQLKDLSHPESVFQLCHSDLPSNFPPLRSVEQVPRELPALAELFIGREDEIRTVGKLMRESRLISITGPGGVGKTQLAIAAALYHMHTFPDGAWFCSMTNLTTIEALVEMIESTMRLTATPGTEPLSRLASGLASRRALVILDGIEHILAGVKNVVANLLDSCQHVVFVCTSREVLHARRERVVALGPLDVPGPNISDVEAARRSASIELFERRAQLADPSFRLTEYSLPAVVSICSQLDGLPLAVELAAAQMGTLQPQDLADRIGRRIALIDDRDQTLGTVIDWSYSSLSEKERLLFHRLAVFAGGFSLALAERVCADDRILLDDVMPGLVDLADKSVISIQRTAEGNRYVMLGLLRSYAINHLANPEEIGEQRQRHLVEYLDFAARAKVGLSGHSEAEWVKRVSLELANLRAAFAWAMESGQLEKAFELIYYIDAYSRERSFREIDSWSEQALGQATGEETYVFSALTVLATSAARNDDIDSALQLADEALESARRSSYHDLYTAYRQVAIAAILTGNTRRALGASEEAIQLAIKQQLPLEIARFKSMKAHAAIMSPDDVADAKDLARSALMEARDLRNPSLLAWCLYVKGFLETDEDKALSLLEEAIEFADMVDNRYVSGLALQATMWKRQTAGRVDIASWCSRVISHWYRVANWASMAISLRMCAEAMDGINDQLVAVINGYLSRTENRIAFSAGYNEPYAQLIASVTVRMGEEAYQAAAQQGVTMDPTQMVNYCKKVLETQS